MKLDAMLNSMFGSGFFIVNLTVRLSMTSTLSIASVMKAFSVPRNLGSHQTIVAALNGSPS